MALSAFDDPAHCPESGELTRVLRGAAAAWRQLVAHVTRTYAPIAEQWSFSGAKYGWSLRLKQVERSMVAGVSQLVMAQSVAAEKNLRRP